jgi:hypothetical protein
LVVNGDSFDPSSEFYVVPSSSPQSSFPFDNYLDFSSLQPATPCKDTQPDILRSQLQASGHSDTRVHESDALNNQIPSLSGPETFPINDYLNPEPSELIWSILSRSQNNQDDIASTDNLSSTGLSIDFDWNDPLNAADILYPTTFPAEPDNAVAPEMGHPPTRSSDSIELPVMSRSVTSASPRKRSRPSSSSSPESGQSHKRLIPSAVYRCKWALCLETFNQASDLR